MDFVGNNYTNYFNGNGTGDLDETAEEMELEDEAEIYTCGQCCKVFVNKGLLDLHQYEQHQGQCPPTTFHPNESQTQTVEEEEEFILGFDNEDEQYFDDILQEVEMDETNGNGGDCSWFDDEIIDGIVLDESDPSTSALQVASDRHVDPPTESMTSKSRTPQVETVELSKEEVDRIAKERIYREVTERVVRICIQDIGWTMRVRCQFCHRRMLLAELKTHQLAKHPFGHDRDRNRPKSPNQTPTKIKKKAVNGTVLKKPPSSPSTRKCFKCSFCDKSFVVPSQCKSHENTHRVKAEVEPPPPTEELKSDSQLLPSGTGSEIVKLQKPLDAEIIIESVENVVVKLELDENEKDEDTKAKTETELPESTTRTSVSGCEDCKTPSRDLMQDCKTEALPLSYPTSKGDTSPKKKKCNNRSNSNSRDSFKGRKLEPMKENFITKPSIDVPDPMQKQTCMECGEEVLTSELLAHIYGHVVKNQRQCPLCDHRSRGIFDLKDHITGKHYALKPHACSICGMRFVWRSGLRGHEENCPSTAKRFNCSACKARFSTNRERRRHELVHKSLKGPDEKIREPSPDNNAGILKTKHNILSKKPSDGIRTSSVFGWDPTLGGGGGGSDSMSSPELTSLLENYVKDPREEHLIELDPLTDHYSESFLRSLTKPSFLASNFGVRETTVAVAFAMNSSSTAGAPSSNGDGGGVAVNDGGSLSRYETHAPGQVSNWGGSATAAADTGFVEPSLTQQHHPQLHPNEHGQQMQPGAPNMTMGSAPPQSHIAPPGQHFDHVIDRDVSSIHEDALGEEDGEEDDDDEYYRDEDKRYTEPPDTRTGETCKICSEVIPMTSLREHIQSHVPKGQLECSICNYKSFNAKYLLDHLNIHYALKPYECERCGRHFTFHGYLRSHIKQVHMQSKNRPHECRFCDKKFVRPCHRRTHERSHKGEVPKDKRPTPPSTSRTPPPQTPGGAPDSNPNPAPSNPATINPQVYHTPIKKESFDMSVDLLSSPTTPKMTATWPPIAPPHQDPWLNPIQPQHNPHPSDPRPPHQQSQTYHSQPPPPPNQHYLQQQQQPRAHSPHYSLPPTPTSHLRHELNPYYSPPPAPPLYHQQQQSGYGSPQAQLRHSASPALPSLGPLPSFGSTYTTQSQFQSTPAPQRLPVEDSWGSPMQQSPPPLRNLTGHYGEHPANNPEVYVQQPVPMPAQSNSNAYYYGQQQSHSQSPVAQPSYPSFSSPPPPGPQPSQSHIQMEPVIGYNNNNNRFIQPQPLPLSPQTTATLAPMPVYNQQQGYGFQQQQPPAPDYSITTPSTSTFDLWAELRDEELRLFPETSNMYPSMGQDPFASPRHSNNASVYLRNNIDPMLGSYFGDAPPSQYNNNNCYGQDPFANPTASTSMMTPCLDFGYGGTTSSTNLQQQQNVVRVKVKIRLQNGQSVLVQPPSPQIKTEPGNHNSTTAAATASASRELIPAGGRRLSSDDLEDLQLTNSKCLVCAATLSGGQDILEHIASHLPRGGTHCSICDRSFAHSWYLKVHTYKHYGIKLYECTYCHRKFSKRHSLTAHIEQTHSRNRGAAAVGAQTSTESACFDADQICAVCKKKCSSRFALRRHQKIVHGAVRKAEVISTGAGVKPRYTPAHVREEEQSCPAYTDEEMEIQIPNAHLNIFLRGCTIHLADIGNETRECPICKQDVPIRQLLTHKTEHREICHICGKEVAANEIISHGSTHVNSSLHCELCNWKGKQKSQIWEHMNGHLGNKPLKCEYCGVGFASRSSVRLHTIARHTNIRLHKCDFCDARFVTPQVKRMHQLQHYDTNCPFCNKYFALKKDLAIHIRRHYKMSGQKLVLKEGEEVDDGNGKGSRKNGGASAAGKGIGAGGGGSGGTSFTDYDTSSNTSTSNTGSMLSSTPGTNAGGSMTMSL